MARQGWNEEDTYKVQDQTSWGGFAGRAKNPDGSPGGMASGSAQDVTRYRGMGNQAAGRDAYQLDFGQANDDRSQAQGARNDQSAAMSMTRAAAMGNAPSRAELMGRQMIGNSLDAQMAAAASARGGALAQASATSAAQQGAAQFQQRGMNDLAALRADEMARAREAYASQAGAMRGQDYQAAAQAAQMAQAQGQSELAQRQLNDAAQGRYEQMAWDTNRAQQQGALERYRVDRDVEEKTNQRNYERQQKSDDRAWGAVSSAAGGLFGWLSDERKKDSLGSLDKYFSPKASDAMSARDERLGLGAGSSDWERWGSKAKDEGDPDWSRGGVTKPRAEGSAAGASSGPATDQRQAPAMSGPLGGIMQRIGGGYSASQGFRSDERVKDTYRGVALLGNSDEGELRQDGDRAYYDRPQPVSVVPEKYRTMQAAREAGGAAAPPGDGGGARRPKRSGGGVDLDKLAAELERSTKAEWGARLAQGPAIRRVAEGTPENGYTTQLTEGGEKAFQRWREKHSPWDTGHDYDLRGAYADGIDRDARGHLPDTYKKPNHETFSDESTYAKYAPGEAGSWDGETYKPKGPPAWLRQEVRGRDPMADANRAMDPEVYRYKPGNGEDPNRLHVGPMAQRMAADPVASTAVRQLPDGTLAVDGASADRLALAGNAANQRQIDELRAEIARLKGGR